ncbi:MAG: hypothetical protein IKE20_03540 [Eggerthellaceae bacterium]|nr:hypothetical protein [Eggerthellaceae bacterium]
MKILTHYIALVIGGCMGFAAASILSAEKPTYSLTPTRCRDCVHSRIEKHTGDSELVCWRHGTHGEIVKPTDFCSNAKVKP